MALSIFILLPILLLAHEAPLPKKTNVQLHPDSILVIFGTRHGNRNPEKLVETKDKHWGEEGELELTSIGKRQAFGLGREMRSFIGKLIDVNYRPSQAKFYSSSANRCQMTLQSAVAGVYDPSGWADWNTKLHDHWSPVPYTMDDPMLRMYSVKGCVNSDKAWDPISKDTLPELQKLVKDNKALLNYMKEKDGRDATIGNAADIADNILNMDFYNVSYPAWLANPTLPGYNAAKIKKAFLSFAENHMNKCAAHKPCREMMGGVWADHIVKSLDAAAASTSKTRLIGYASHTEVTLSTMKLLGIDKDELTTSAGFVLELRKMGASHAVRILQHDPNPIDDHVIYKAKLVKGLIAIEGWVPLDIFKKFVAKASFADWEVKCGIDRCKV